VSYPVYAYTIHPNAEAAPIMSIPASSPARGGYDVPLARAVRELSGREPGPWLGKNLHRKGRCYVACRKTGSLGTSGGFIVARTLDGKFL
jgi:hypothetical protein